MKKLLYIFLTVLIVACSGSDDDSNNDITQNLVGAWMSELGDPETDEVEGFITLTLNVDSTGSFGVDLTGGSEEVEPVTISWSSTATTLTLVSDDGDGDDVVCIYNFITDDQLSLTGDIEVILDRVD
jgi:hypothetical protein